MPSSGSPRRAEQEFENAIRLGSQRPAGEAGKFVCLSHERVARLLALRGKNLDARKHVAAYRQADPDNRLGRLDRILLTEALIFWIERRFSDSIRALEEGMQRFPSSAERDRMLLAMGVVYMSPEMIRRRSRLWAPPGRTWWRWMAR